MLLQKKQKRQVVITGQKRKHHETFVLGGYQKLISTIMPKIAHRLKKYSSCQLELVICNIPINMFLKDFFYVSLISISYNNLLKFLLILWKMCWPNYRYYKSVVICKSQNIV